MVNETLAPNTSLALIKAAQTDATAAAQKLKSSQQAANADKIEEAAIEFEAVFIAEMMKPLFQGLSTDAPFGGGKGEEIFRGMMIQEYGKIMAQTGTIGIADQVRAEMINMQAQMDKGAGR